MRILLTVVAMLCSVNATLAAGLPDQVQRVLTGLGVGDDDVSILIRRVGATESLLNHNADTPRNPASVMKLVTTWSALELLGPAFTWPTEVYFLDAFDGATLHGDIGIKGYGDPFLVAEELWKLLHALRRLGLEEIQGNVLLDTSFFELEPVDPGAFDDQPYRTYNVPPTALLANFKAIRFQFFADQVNGRVRIATDPELANLDIRNRLRLVDGPCRAYQAGVSFNVLDRDEINQIEFDGNFSAGCSGFGLTRTVLQHDSYFFGLFESLWREVGGRVRGGVRDGIIPSTADRVLTWQSPPLGEIVRSINKNSNNVMTRQLLLTLGATQPEPPGTIAKGLESIEEFLRQRGIHDGSLVMENGAGLSRNARVSARMLVDLLDAADRSPYAPEFIASLSLAGEDGTTRGRFNGRESVLHLKTGRLDHVSALAGLAHASDGADYALAILVNTPEAHRGLGQEIEEAVLAWLETQI
jgi:serine-type D-Ala-D-Ala carboxypeptidase/endopeptidase (penicillin-binding protein 4)